MDYESVFRLFTRSLGGGNSFQRIDKLWDIANLHMSREEFEGAIDKLKKSHIIRLSGGDPSIMTEEEISKCITDDKERLRITFSWVEEYTGVDLKKRVRDLTQENDSLKEQVERLNRNCNRTVRAYRRLKDRFGELEKSIANKIKRKKQKTKAPISIIGWNIQFSGKYYRAFKRINGKVEGCYLGKNNPLDHLIRTEVKLREKEKELKNFQERKDDDEQTGTYFSTEK